MGGLAGFVAGLGTCLRLDWRRGFPWIATAAAMAAAATVVGRSVPFALAAAAVVTVAAIGDPPPALAGPLGPWIVGRCLGPAVAGVATLTALGAPTAIPAAAGWLAGTLAAAVAFVVTRVAGQGTSRGTAMTSCTAGGVAMLSVFSAAAGLATGDGRPWVTAVVTGLWLSAVVAWGVVLPRLAAPGPSVAEGLTAAAMLSTLGGMVVWLFLVPEHSGRFTWLVGAWFLALALPRTTLAAGVCDERRRRVIARFADSPAGGAATFHALILGWPLVVAAGLAGSGGVAAQRLLVVAALIAAATAAGAVTRGMLSAGGSREAAQAGLVAALAGAVLFAGAARDIGL